MVEKIESEEAVTDIIQREKWLPETGCQAGGFFSTRRFQHEVIPKNRENRVLINPDVVDSKCELDYK